jgi:hypothetical protein
VSFGRAYLKSRSSDSFTSEIKDFIAPLPISVSNCQPRNLPNNAWVKASNFAPPGGQLGDPIGDSGLIRVTEPQSAMGPTLTTPTQVRLALLPASASDFVPARRRDERSGVPQRSGTPWPPAVGSDDAWWRRVIT